MTRTQRETLAAERLKEATRIRQALDVKVARHRASWRAAAPDQAAKAERRLRLALEDQKAAEATEKAARLECYG